MADSTYTPPEVWSVDTESGGRFANINRPTAGAREEKELPVGKQPFQLHSLATPNGVTPIPRSLRSSTRAATNRSASSNPVRS